MQWFWRNQNIKIKKHTQWNKKYSYRPTLFPIQKLQGKNFTTQKLKFSIKNFFSKCDQIRRKLRIWPRLLKKSLMESFIFYAVLYAKNDFLIWTIFYEINLTLVDLFDQYYDLLIFYKTQSFIWPLFKYTCILNMKKVRFLIMKSSSLS